MKAAVYAALKTIEFQDRPMLKAGPGEVVVKIKYCGICRTDVDIYFEGLLPPGIVPGHENVGTVAEVGAPKVAPVGSQDAIQSTARPAMI